MQKRQFLSAVACATLVLSAASAMAQDKFKIGLILPMTGPFASTGKQIEAAARLYTLARAAVQASPLSWLQAAL